MVDGEVRLHGPELVVLKGRPHALGLLTGAVLGVAVHGLAIVLVAAQSCWATRERRGDTVKLLTSLFDHILRPQTPLILKHSKSKKQLKMQAQTQMERTFSSDRSKYKHACTQTERMNKNKERKMEKEKLKGDW